MTTVTIIGLGDMGGAFADALLGRGHVVTVWNRNPARAARHVEAGATAAGSPAEAIVATPLTVICVSDHAATMVLLDGAGEAVRGRTLVQVSTMTSAQSQELAAWAEAHGADYLDAQILDFPDDVRAGRANLVVSGPKDLFARHEAVLTDMA